MKERIKQLAIEANLIASESNGFDQTRLSKAQQKFAELIVDDICNDMMSLEPMYPANIVALKIRQKYGVGSKENLGALDQYDDPAWQGKQGISAVEKTGN
jgi:hypothetical protein